MGRALGHGGSVELEPASRPHFGLGGLKGKMNTLRTTMLLAALTALFMGLGYLIGGTGGALIALVIAAGMNLFTYWNADKIVLRMHNARGGRRAAPARSSSASSRSWPGAAACRPRASI